MGCPAVSLALFPFKRACRAEIFPLGAWKPVELISELERAPLPFSPVANYDDVGLKMSLVQTHLRDLRKQAAAPRKGGRSLLSLHGPQVLHEDRVLLLCLDQGLLVGVGHVRVVTLLKFLTFRQGVLPDVLPLELNLCLGALLLDRCDASVRSLFCVLLSLPSWPWHLGIDSLLGLGPLLVSQPRKTCPRSRRR